MSNILHLSTALPVHVHNGGLFVSQGKGRHPTRIIDSYELIFVRQGRLGMHEDDQSFEMHAGQTLLLWPGRLHGGTLDYPHDLRFYWIHFSLAPRDGDMDATPAACDLPQFTTVRRPDRLTELFRQFLDDQETGQRNPFIANLLMTLMLAEVAHVDHDAGEAGGMAVLLAQRAVTYILANFAHPISTSSIAQALDCNSDYLGRVFISVYGHTVTEAIHRHRLHHARLLLLDSDLPVAQIAASCGYEDVGYFRRVFRRYEGMPPLAYRHLYARVHVNTT